MKKIQLLMMIVPCLMYSQVLIQDDFNTFTTGPVSSVINGTEPGIDGYYVIANAFNSSSDNFSAESAQFQAFNGSTALQIFTPNGPGGAVYVWKGGLEDAWNNRTSGNDIIKASVDFTPTSQNGRGVYYFALYDNSSTRYIMAGARLSLYDMQIRPLCRYDNEGTINTYFFNLPTADQVIMELGTTYHIEIEYNKADQKMRLLVDGVFKAEYQTAISATANPNRVVMFSQGYSGNTAQDTGYYDNLLVSATNPTSLDIDEIENISSKSLLYPNPVKESFTIKLAENFDASNTTYTITDMNGKLILNRKIQEINTISGVAPGIYLITITDGLNTEHQKLIKQ